MPRPFTPKIITANDLLEGDVIYYTADNSWTREMSQAELIEDEAEAQLRLIEAGHTIATFSVEGTSLSVDTPEQLEEARRMART